MAKKKKVEPEEDEFEVDEFDELEDEEIEIAVPIIKKEPKEKLLDSVPSPAESAAQEEVVFEEEIEGYEPEVEEKRTYKYLNLSLQKGLTENDYELRIEGQSHGFCNILVKRLLEIEGVNIAAYKITGIEPPQVFIRLENGYDIKEILYKGVEALREEVVEVQKLFQNNI